MNVPFNIKIKEEKELVDTCLELAHILNNLRFWTKYFDQHYYSDGGRYKKRKDYWEERADNFLAKIGVADKIVIENISIQPTDE